jgi:uncharacterized membrane protein YhaH (DUF805 family)
VSSEQIPKGATRMRDRGWPWMMLVAFIIYLILLPTICFLSIIAALTIVLRRLKGDD